MCLQLNHHLQKENAPTPAWVHSLQQQNPSHCLQHSQTSPELPKLFIFSPLPILQQQC